MCEVNAAFADFPSTNVLCHAPTGIEGQDLFAIKLGDFGQTEALGPQRM